MNVMNWIIPTKVLSAHSIHDGEIVTVINAAHSVSLTIGRLRDRWRSGWCIWFRGGLPLRRWPKCRSSTCWARGSLAASILFATTVGGGALTPAPRANGAPAPEVEYAYDVGVRRHYDFPNNDALTYGHGICDKVSRGEGYRQVLGEVKTDVTPSDEFAANYLVSYAVSLLCPELTWQLRNSAAGYRPPGGVAAPGTY